MSQLSGKLAIVTGASRGIGEAVAHNLADKGADLVLNHSSASSAQDCNRVADELRARHPARSVVVVQADMGSVNGPRAVVAAAPGRQIDVVVNNAGVSGNHHIHEVTVDEFDRQYRVNVRGPLLLLQAALPFLPADRSGRIVNVSSVSATLGLHAQSVYGGTKAALDAMTRTWARELAERATVNSVNPGPVDTRMYGSTSVEFQELLRPMLATTPLAQLSESEKQGAYRDRAAMYAATGGRCATPQEVAGIVGMLCTPDAGFCTGQVVCANGGMIFGTA